jgi:Molybdopterin biosynthesis enzyme
MISVDEAQRRITSAFSPIDTETMDLGHLAGRVLAEDVRAKHNQPPFAASAMDGYAVRLADGDGPRTVIGTAPAGHPFDGSLEAGQAVRIFTGGQIPDGADAIVIQEDVSREGDIIRFQNPALHPDFIRPAGLDFKQGDVLLAAGKRVNARDMALLAAGDITHAKVRRRPRVAIASIGDELSAPGEPRKPGGIVASTGYGLTAMITTWGGAPCDFGILPDTASEIATIADANAEIVVTLGGVSVGDHDLVQAALGTTDFELDFWKVAMRPGKPLLFGRLGSTAILGLPGNPVSALVCAILFLRPAIDAMLGTAQHSCSLSQRLKCGCRTTTALLKGDLPENDSRQAYLRARLTQEDGELWAEPFLSQDSSMLSVLTKADALLVRAPGAAAATTGARVEIIPLDGY